MPQWSRTIALVMTVSRAPCARWWSPLRHRLADRLAAAEDGLLAADGEVLLDLDPQVGVAEPDLVADRRAVQRGILGAVRSRPSSLQDPAVCPELDAGNPRPPCSATAATSRDAPGSNRSEVPDGMSSRNPWAAPRSNARAVLASGRCRCEPIWTGRSPVLTMTSSIRSDSLRSAFSTMVPSAVRMAPGPVELPAAIGLPLRDRLVDGDELAAVREGRLDLDVGEHLGDAVHHLFPGQHLPARAIRSATRAPSRARSITQVVSSATVSG